MKTESKTNPIIIYCCAGGGTPKGPFAWCTRIIKPNGLYEIAGASAEVHFSKLYTVGAIATLNALPEGSHVRFVCADQNAVGRFAIAQDVALGRNRQKWKNRSTEIIKLCAELYKAMERHTKVTTEVVPIVRGCDEHVETSRRVDEVIDEFMAQADFGAKMPDRSRLRPVTPAQASTIKIEAEPEVMPSLRGEPAVYLQSKLDLPW